MSYIYTVCETSKQSDRESEGFTGGNVSTDGTLVVGDKGNLIEISIFSDTPKPSYITAEELPNWPYLTISEAKFLISKKASSEGASDGWLWDGNL